MTMLGRVTLGIATDVGGVEVGVGADVAGVLLVGDAGDPICFAPGIRLRSGCGNGMTG
jgi:hypothetical protein